jgi:hypothetical protein
METNLLYYGGNLGQTGELSPRGQSDNADVSRHLTAAESPDVGGNRGR